MIKKQLILVVCTVGLVACGIFWVGQAKSTQPKLNPQTPNQGLSSQQATGIPDHIFYGEVFSLLAALKNTSDYQKQASLTDEQTADLLQIAEECEAETTALDAKAQKIIQEFRKHMDESQIKKDKPLPIPAGLTELQNERDAVVLRHRDQLRNVLGEETFGRFKEASRTIVKIDLTTAQ